MTQRFVSRKFLIWDRGTEMKDEKNNDNNSNLAIGICLGVLFGTALDNLALGLCLGVAFGLLFDTHKKK